MVSSSIAIAPTLGGLVLSVASWPWIFAAASPLALLSLLLGARSLPEPLPRDDPYDVRAAVLCALTFGLIISGLESAVHGGSAADRRADGRRRRAFAVVFVRRELTSKIPILPVDLLMRPVVGWSALGGLLVFIASMTVMLSLPFRLQQHYGFLPGEVGAMLTPWPLAILHRSGRPRACCRIAFRPGYWAASAWRSPPSGYCRSLSCPLHVSHFDMVWRMALSGAGFGLFVAPNARVIIHAAPHERAASAGGLISTTRLTGQTLGATLLAALLSLGVGTGPVPALLAAGLAVLAGICSVAGCALR